MIERVLQLLATTAPDLGRWLSLGLALLTVAMLQLWRGARSGNGWLTLCALPLDEDEKARSKRLYRLLRNRSLGGTEMTPLLVRLALGRDPRAWVPIVVDQTSMRGTQVIMAGVRVACRVLPVVFTCFEYDTIRKSQNILENSLLLLIASCLPPQCKPVFVMDRGYARASLLKQLRSLNIPFVLRGRGNTIVRVGRRRLSLGRLARRLGRARRYANVAYQPFHRLHPRRLARRGRDRSTRSGLLRGLAFDAQTWNQTPSRRPLRRHPRTVARALRRPRQTRTRSLAHRLRTRRARGGAHSMNRPHAPWTPLQSSLLSSIRYSLDATLELEFRSGAIYRYFAVPQPVFEGLIAADSKGAYFNHSVRGRFPYHRLA